MSAAFYKTSDHAVLAALAAFESEASSVAATGKAFAAHYGGEMLARRDVLGYSIAGLRFHPAKDDSMWTKPDPTSAGMQRPRTSMKGASKEERAALGELRADWCARFPYGKAEFAKFLDAIGTDWGHLILCGFTMFQHDGAIYAATSAKLATCMVEIMASEYSAAKAAYENIKF